MKSNALNSLFTPGLIAFGWDSGAAAFCSILRRRLSQRELFKRKLSTQATGETPQTSTSSDELHPSGEDEILLRGNPDLLVVWSPFMGRGKADPATIATKIEEMVQFQTHMHLHCGGKGTKMIFILTSVPAEWTLPGERLMDRGVTLVNEVQDFMHTKSQDGPRNPIIELTSAADEIGDLEARGSHGHNLPTIDDIRYSFRLSRSVNMSHQEQLMQYHQNPNCWIPMPVAIARPYAEFVSLLDDRMTAILREMHTIDGPDIATFFVTSSESEVEEMGVFKYEWVYDEVNRSIIDAQVKYLKNPAVSTSGQSASNEEPTSAHPIAVDVLCSCDYSTTKMDQLRKSVKKVADNQKTVPVPASLNFVPDA